MAEEVTPEPRRALAEEARRERLVRSISDMDDAGVAARWLHATHREVNEQPGFDDLRLRIVMETGLFTTYARPFTESRGDPPLPVAPTSGLDEAQRKVHEWALERRKKSAAHVDRKNVDRVLVGSDMERYRPPAPDELLALAELAEQLAARYRADVYG